MMVVMMVNSMHWSNATSGIIMGMCLANKRRRYNVTPSFIGWAHTQNDFHTIAVIRARHILLLDDPVQVKLPVRKGHLSKVFFYILYE